MLSTDVLERLVGRGCKLHIVIKGQSLFYTVTEVLGVNERHIMFRDRLGKEYVFRVEDVKEASEVM